MGAIARDQPLPGASHLAAPGRAFGGDAHEIKRLPILILMPHAGCNCRCLMCDIWKGNRGAAKLERDLVERLVCELRGLGVEEVLLSGGEPLMDERLWDLCALLKTLPARITLLSTGLLLARHAGSILKWCDEVIVSLDGSREVHDKIRGIPNAFDKLAMGVKELKRHDQDFPISARCVLQKRNFRDLSNIVDAAREIGLDRISFLAADLTSTAFNRPDGWNADRAEEVALDASESHEFTRLIETLIAERPDDFSSRFIAEQPDRLRRLGQYYRAINAIAPFPEVRCAAPWMSSVIEADGTVRPCFFHAPIGNLNDAPLLSILNSQPALAFREALDTRTDPICTRCVCTYNP